MFLLARKIWQKNVILSCFYSQEKFDEKRSSGVPWIWNWRIYEEDETILKPCLQIRGRISIYNRNSKYFAPFFFRKGRGNKSKVKGKGGEKSGRVYEPFQKSSSWMRKKKKIEMPSRGPWQPCAGPIKSNDRVSRAKPLINQSHKTNQLTFLIQSSCAIPR